MLQSPGSHITFRFSLDLEARLLSFSLNGNHIKLISICVAKYILVNMIKIMKSSWKDKQEFIYHQREISLISIFNTTIGGCLQAGHVYMNLILISEIDFKSEY